MATSSRVLGGVLIIVISLLAITWLPTATADFPVVVDDFEDNPYLDPSIWDLQNGSQPSLIQDDASLHWAVRLGLDPFAGRENLTMQPFNLSIFTSAEIEVVWFTSNFIDRPEVGLDFLVIEAWDGSRFVEIDRHTPSRGEGETFTPLTFPLASNYLRDDARIRISSTGNSEDAWLIDSVTVRGTDTPVNLDLDWSGDRWSGSTLTLTARYTNASQGGIAGLTVAWEDGSASVGMVTDASGQATATIMVPLVDTPTTLELQMRASYFGFLIPLDVAIKVLPDQSTVRGELFDDGTNQPISNADVRLYPAGQALATEPVGQVAFITSASDGGFVLEGVPAGIYDLRIRAEGYDAVWRLNISVDPLINVNPANSDTENATLKLGGIFLSLTPEPPEKSPWTSVWLILIYILAALIVVGLIGYFLLRSYRRKIVIEDLFLIYHDGVLIQHQTRRLRPTIGEDVLASMLVAIQSFVQDSFKDRTRTLDQLHFGNHIIIIVRGKWLILAAVLEGEIHEAVKPLLKRAVQDMESKHAEVLKDWDGTVSKLAHLDSYLDAILMR